jgi:hypothetical protein
MKDLGLPLSSHVCGTSGKTEGNLSAMFHCRANLSAEDSHIYKKIVPVFQSALFMQLSGADFFDQIKQHTSIFDKTITTAESAFRLR